MAKPTALPLEPVSSGQLAFRAYATPIEVPVPARAPEVWVLDAAIGRRPVEALPPRRPLTGPGPFANLRSGR